MNREEYMRQLEFLLQDMMENEREEALQYYRDYFDDAGALEEANVIATLGSPERVAAMIKDGLTEQNEEAGEYTDSGYMDERFREDNKVPEPRMDSGRQSEQERNRNGGHYYQRQYSQGQYQRDKAEREPRNNTGKIILIIILCVLAVPVIFPLAGGLFGVVFGIIGGAFGIVMAAFAGCFGLAAGGIGLIGTGIAKLFVSVPSGLVMMGSGMLMLALGALLVLLGVFLAGKFIPWFIRFITGIGSRIFGRRNR